MNMLLGSLSAHLQFFRYRTANFSGDCENDAVADHEHEGCRVTERSLSVKRAGQKMVKLEMGQNIPVCESYNTHVSRL